MAENYQSLGEQLRAARESLAVTLDEAEAHTRIRKKFLQALENGDLSVLPSAAHAKGFLRNYAIFLGLDANAIVNEFLAATGQPPQQSSVPPTPTRPPEDRPARPQQPPPRYVMPEQRTGPAAPRGFAGEPPPADDTQPLRQRQPDPVEEEEAQPQEQRMLPTGSRTANIVAGVILLLGLVGTVALVSALSRLNVAAEPGNAAQFGTPIPTRTPTLTFEPTSTPGDVTTQPENLGVVRLALRAEQSTWVRVTADDEITYEGQMSPGDVITQNAEESIIVLAGNAGALVVNFNGAEIGTLGERGEVVERRFTAEGSIIEPTATPTITPTPTLPPSVTPSS